jgi:hypothetical protein
MKLTIETNKGNFDLHEDDFIINHGLQIFHDEGYYFNYCVLFLYQKNIRSVISDLTKIDKIIWDDGVEINIFENAKHIGGLRYPGIVGINELLDLIDKNRFNKILGSYFKERYKKIKEELVSKIDLNQIGLNVYLTLKK